MVGERPDLVRETIEETFTLGWEAAHRAVWRVVWPMLVTQALIVAVLLVLVVTTA